MAGIPSKYPKCGKTKAWKEEINPIRFFALRGLLARPVKKAIGYYKVTYRCHNCGFRKEYEAGGS